MWGPNRRESPDFIPHWRESCFSFQQVLNCSLQLSVLRGDPQAFLGGPCAGSTGLPVILVSPEAIEGPGVLNFHFYREVIWTCWQCAKCFKINTCLLIVKEGFPRLRAQVMPFPARTVHAFVQEGGTLLELPQSRIG